MSNTPTLTTQSVQGLAPDQSSLKAALGLKSKSNWVVLGSSDRGLWGHCKGSGSKPYSVKVDLSGPSSVCSCPSRKFPCKHGLALMLMYADGIVPTETEPDWVQEWFGARQQRQEKKVAKESAGIDAGLTLDDFVKEKSKAWQRAQDGFDQLGVWMRDHLKNGLVMLSQMDSTAQALWNSMSAQMVDAQMPAISKRLQDIRSALGERPDWVEHVVMEFGRFDLLAKMVSRRSELTGQELFNVMLALGWPIPKKEVAHFGVAMDDHWMVVDVQTKEEAQGRSRSTWVYGQRHQELLALFDFAPNGAGFAQSWAHGETYKAQLCRYPGSHSLRALINTDQAMEFVPLEKVPSFEPAAYSKYVANVLAHNPLWSSHLEWVVCSKLCKVEKIWYAQIQGSDFLLPLDLKDTQAITLLTKVGNGDFLIFASIGEVAHIHTAWRMTSKNIIFAMGE